MVGRQRCVGAGSAALPPAGTLQSRTSRGSSLRARRTRGQQRRDRGAFRIGETAPAADLGEGAPAAETEACGTVDDADLDARGGDAAGRILGGPGLT